MGQEAHRPEFLYTREIMQEGSKISMQFSRQPTPSPQAFPQLRKPSGSNSNRDRIRVPHPPHIHLFFRSLLAKRLAVPSGSISNRQSQLLEIGLSHTKQSTSIFLIANFGALLAPPCAAEQQFT
jgi:hypothetical protein